MSKVGMGIAVLLATLQWSGCAQDHTPPAENSSSGSNWLRCQELADCSAAPLAVVCGSDGFCVDSRGERIAARAADAGAPDAQQSMAPSEGEDAGVSSACAWGVDDLLREVRVDPGDRRNCGFFRHDTSPLSVAGALACFERPLQGEQAAQITFNRSFDSLEPFTYVTTKSGQRFEIEMVDSQFAGAERWAIVRSCGSLPFDAEQGGLSCSDPETRYECREPRSATAAPFEDPPVEPYKLTDLEPAGDSAVLHLYVSNQSFEEPLVDIGISLNEVQVIAGDFAVEGQHNWYEFDIEVPLGALSLVALSIGAEEAVHFDEEIAVPAERWAVIDYWYYSDDPKGRHFSLTVSDMPVSFD